MRTFTKDYKSSSFQNKIEISLANISSSPEDEFKLVKTSYKYFNCELCDHKHCMFQFTIENIKTKKQLNVGSECINHFKGKGIDIDLAMGLLKRIQATVLKARKDMREDINEDDYKGYSIEEKRQLTVKYYIREQAKELLMDVARNKTVLSKIQVNEILDLGLKNELEKAEKRQQALENLKKSDKVAEDFDSLIKEAKEKVETIHESVYMEYSAQWRALCPYEYVKSPVDTSWIRFKNDIEKLNKYLWLTKYKGSNKVVVDIKDRFLKYGSLTEKQEAYAKGLVKKEKAPQILAFVIANTEPSDFILSIKKQYDEKGFISPKQSTVLYSIYNTMRESK